MLFVQCKTVAAAEDETLSPDKMSQEEIEELNLCNTLDTPQELTIKTASKGYQSGTTLVSFLGDSITTYLDYTDYGTAGNYYNETLLPIETTWWMQILQRNNWSLGVNESLGGSRVTWDGQTEDSVYHVGNDYYMASDTRIAKLGANGTPDKIFVFGGTNDILSQGEVEIGTVKENYCYGKVDNFADAYYTMITKTEEQYPEAEIICLLPYHTIYSLAYPDIAQDTEQVCAIITDICNTKDILYVDLRTIGLEGQNDMETQDYVHPNENGMKKIADFVLAEMEPKHGLVEKDGKYYYYDENSKKVKDSLVEYEGNTYYFQEDGSAVTSRRIDDSTNDFVVYFDENAHMVKNKLQKDPDSENVWYFNNDGHQVFDEFVRLEDKVYYFDKNGNQYTDECYQDETGKMHFFRKDSTMIYNDYYFDGDWTYYLQYDGTPMKSRMSYDPEGTGVIYFDDYGHMLFNTFYYCEDVGYTCYFAGDGRAYFDQITFVGDKVYYLNGNGKMEDSGWFQFANGRDYGYANADGTLFTCGFSYDPKGRVVFYHWNGMVARGLINDGQWYYNMDTTDGHYLGQFPFP
ncbi:GDSL-type esterase/lipase family protein [Roseburia sp. 499]|uniref:GDSL-type esterase/lipase family protein n=1 Tax=Roseburia sp. 499 TaxID=1261634 RepID=UPI0013016886|nr:GDSL-type esterase/lipase family protein [Roseburia sp. 499]WVK69459.1 GDSL-type esterase/lipase family protein [Roseburia sp. 499]